MPQPTAALPNRPLWRRLLSTTARTAVTLLVLGGAAATGVTAHGMLSARAAQVEGPVAAPLTTVAPVAVHLQQTVTLTRSFTGQFEAPQETALGFEEAGTLAEISVRAGDRVAKGTVIARLDTSLLNAERARLEASRRALDAQVELARRTDDRQRALLDTGHVSSQRVDETSLQLAQLQASLAEVDAAIAGLEVRLGKTELRAPFAGRVGVRTLDTGAIVSPGLQVLTLLEDGPARFRVGLPPELAARMEDAQAVTVTSSAASYPARLTELTPELDAATRSQIAFFEITSQTTPPARATGDLRVSQKVTATGAWVPLSALRQGPRGSWLLLTVEGAEQPVIGSEAVEILHLDGERAFVRGSFPDGTLILPTGTHRVVPGEAVRVAEAS